MLYIFATFGNLYHGNTNESSADLRSRILGENWIPLIRGVNRLLQQIRERVSVGLLSSLLRIGNWNDPDPDTATVPYDAKMQSLKSIWANYAAKGAYCWFNQIVDLMMMMSVVLAKITPALVCSPPFTLDSRPMN